MFLIPNWGFLFLAISTNFCYCVAQGTPEQQQKTAKLGEDIRENIVEFIRTNVQDSSATMLEAITKSEYNLNNDISNTAGKIISQLFEETKLITDKINTTFREIKMLETIAEINSKLVALETKNNEMNQNIQKLLNNGVSTTGVENNKDTNTKPANKGPECGPKVPNFIKTKSDIWINRADPKMDDLDTYLNKTMNCYYEGVRIRDSYYVPERLFDGSSIEEHFALRTQNRGIIRVWWKLMTTSQFKFDIGANETKFVDTKDHPEKILATVPASGMLSPDSYTQFYVKIDNESLSFGKTCDAGNQQLFTHKITIKKGDVVYIRFDPLDFMGGKIIRACGGTISGSL